MASRAPNSYTQSTNLADLIERVLDKGVMIAGDVKVNLLDIELLTIQIRLVICSIDKAKEMGMDWWANTPVFMGKGDENEKDEEIKRLQDEVREKELVMLRERVRSIEAALGGDEEAADRLINPPAQTERTTDPMNPQAPPLPPEA